MTAEQAPARAASTPPAPGSPDSSLVRELLEASHRETPPLRPSQRALVSVAFDDLVRSAARSASSERLGRGRAEVSS